MLRWHVSDHTRVSNFSLLFQVFESVWEDLFSKFCSLDYITLCSTMRQKKCRQICRFFSTWRLWTLFNYFQRYRSLCYSVAGFEVQLFSCICIVFNKEKTFQIHLFIEAPLWGRTRVKWGKQTREAEGMKAIIGLWRSKAINCGEIRRLEWFAGKPSEGIGYGIAGRKKVPAECWEEILSVICATTHGRRLILALLCHQKQVICCKKPRFSTSMKPHRD